jgi:MFS family permease
LWAAYEQGVLLMMFDTIREEERTSLWATFNLGNSAAMVGGSLVGAWLLGESRDLGAYAGAFLLSVALRLGTVVFLIRAHELLEPPKPIYIGNAHPAESSIDAPIMPAMSSDRPR